MKRDCGSANRPVDTSRDDVLMIGLDFGTTTSSAMVAKARIGLHCATGRMGFGNPEVIYRSEPVFTPYDNERICEEAIDALLDGWLSASGISPEQLFSGGVMITGLAAQHHNTTVIAARVRARFGDIIVATADDPALESWLAFMGGASVLSRYHHGTPIINLDIGGGTTNPALGRDGQVLSTGCSFIGARHFRFEPGTWRVTGISGFGEQLLDALGLTLAIGDILPVPAREQILDFYIAGLVATVTGDRRLFETKAGRQHEQVRFDPQGHTDAVITYSGGIGELLYRHVAGEPWPETTCFGDLGVDLARRIADHPLLARSLHTHIPENRGRATVYGLTLHSTEISGTTLFLSHQAELPLQDLPIVARLSLQDSVERLRKALELARKCSHGACLQVLPTETGATPSLDMIKAFGGHMAMAIESGGFPADLPLVLLVPNDCGKAMGNYASRWRTLAVRLTVIDEVPDRTASFVNVGAPQHHIIPVSFYGMQ